MANIKDKLRSKYSGLLDYFEKNVGEIEIYGTARDGYYIHPKGTKGFSTDMLSTIGAHDVEGLALFLQGVTQSERVKRRFADEKIRQGI